MALPTSFYSYTMADNTAKSNGEAETANFRLAITGVTALNFDAVQTARVNLAIAIQAITLGNTIRQASEVNVQSAVNIPASDPLAQRENKWLCRYHGATLLQKFSVSIPTADLSLHMPNSEFLDLTGGPGATFKTAFEALVKSPNDGAEAVILDSVQFVGRNS